MYAQKFPRIPVFRLPIFWLFLGPPVFRLVDHGAGASLEGSFDFWNALRSVWWGFFGAVAFLELYQRRAHLTVFLRTMGWLPWFAGAWLASIFISTANSPAPVFTFATGVMLFILVLAALDLALKLSLGIVDFHRVLSICFGISVVLLTVFAITLIVAPQLVGSSGGLGARARGGHVADAALLGQIVFFVGIYLATSYRGVTGAAVWLAVALSPFFVLVAQTRAMYITFFVGSAVVFWYWVLAARQSQRHALLGLACISFAGLVGLALFDEVRMDRKLFEQVESYLVRDEASIQGFNSRDGVAKILLARVSDNPLGLGYSAGPRHVLLSAEHERLQHNIYEAFAGNAHNMYLEVLSGGGLVGAAAWVLLLAWLLFSLLGAEGRAFIPVRALVVVVLLGGITESNGALPFFQQSSLLWILVALVAGYRGRMVLGARFAPVMILSGPRRGVVAGAGE